MRQDVARRRPMSQLSDRAKRALALGGSEAIRLHRNVVGPEHLIVGLLCCGEAAVLGALEAGGLQVDKVREAVETLTGRGDVHGEITEVTPSSSTRGVIDRAAAGADRTGNEPVEPEHVLLSVLQEPTASRVLESLGTSADAIRRNLLADSQG
jgi:ATP-dependent Clp protease ATP-binding subunit ClpC